MGEVKHINNKNRTYYFYNDVIDIKNFEPKSFKNIDIYYIGYIKINKND